MEENEANVAIEQPAAEMQPTYKSKMLDRIKSKKPDFASDDEEEMMAELEAIFSETEGAKNEYEGIANKLNDLTVNDPKFAAVLEVMRTGKSFGYSVAKIYGKDFFDAEDEDMDAADEEYRSGVEAANSDKDKVRTNMQSLVDRIISNTEIKEEQREVIFDKIRDKIERYQYCEVPDSDIEDEIKALNYDEDIAIAEESVAAEVRNEKIDMKLKRPTDMPDMGGMSGRGEATAQNMRSRSPLDRFKTGK